MTFKTTTRHTLIQHPTPLYLVGLVVLFITASNLAFNEAETRFNNCMDEKGNQTLITDSQITDRIKTCERITGYDLPAKFWP